MKYENKINIDTKDNKKIKSKLIEYFKVNQNRTYNFNYLSKLFGFNDDEENVFKTMLKELELEGKILIKDDEITYFKKNDRLKIGKIKFNSDNKPYVTYNNSEKSKIYIENLNGAINGDIVLIETEENTTKKIGNVLKIINRLNDEIILDCVIDEKNNYTLVPKDKSFIYDIELDYLDTKTLVDGSRIKIKLHDFKNGKYYASVSDLIGHKDDPDLEIRTIASDMGWDISFSKDSITEAYKLPTSVKEEDLKNRLDLRNETIFTIDGKDTKDMDDAISIKKDEEGNYILGVHIADVSNYIKQGSFLFTEALKRSTSCYPVGYVVPMFPHIISNGICSLNPNVDRLTLSVIMKIDNEGNVIDYDIKKSVINSKKKMTYEDVNKILVNNEMVPGYENFINDLKLMEELHHILDTNKKNRGYLNFGDHDIKVEYNLNGNVKSISLLTRKVSEMMIEDFMLKANETVATFARSLQLIFNYRVHPSPNPEIIKQKIEYINSLGFDIKLPKNLNNPFAIQNIMKQFNKTPLSEALNEILLQGMRSAYYSTSNIGHYGLGINALKGEAYCHFTSPIRRVMDLIVHMIIKEIITDEKYFDKENFESFVNEICSWSSSKQRLEDKIEKECIGFRTAQYMQNNIGKTFEGKIAYISKKSIMIITKENVYANIKLRDLSENCRFDPKTCTFNLDDKLYTIGDILPVVVTDVDMNSRKVHFKYKKEVNENTVIGNMTKIRRIRN
ncbi:MAG TPA: ribonuclease R [Bacilli bacterium]|nr:ribonuclease R [Bacilli bacterium]